MLIQHKAVQIHILAVAPLVVTHKAAILRTFIKDIQHQEQAAQAHTSTDIEDQMADQVLLLLLTTIKRETNGI